MPPTGSFPLAIDRVSVPAHAPAPVAATAATRQDVPAIAMALAGVLVLGSVAAAAGIAWESRGYGALSIAAGGALGVASLFPLWLVLRRPRARS